MQRFEAVISSLPMSVYRECFLILSTMLMLGWSGWVWGEADRLPPYLQVAGLEGAWGADLPEPPGRTWEAEFTYNPGAEVGTLEVFEIIGLEARLTALRFLEGQYFATTDRGSVLVSEDLRNWRELQVAPQSQSLVDIVHLEEGGGLYVILQVLPPMAEGAPSRPEGESANLVSRDGLHWARIPRAGAFRDGIRALWQVHGKTWMTTTSGGWNAVANWRNYRRNAGAAWEAVDFPSAAEPLGGVGPESVSRQSAALLEAGEGTISLTTNGWILEWGREAQSAEILRKEPLETFTPFAEICGGANTWILSATGYTLNDTVFLIKQGLQPWGRLEPGIGGTAYALAYADGRWVLSAISQADSREWEEAPPRHEFSGGSLWTSGNGFDWTRIAGVDRFTGSLEATPKGVLAPGPRGQYLVWRGPPGEGGKPAPVQFKVERPFLAADLDGELPQVHLLRRSSYAGRQLKAAVNGEPEGLTFVGKSLLEGRDLYYSTPESGVLFLRAARKAGSAEASWALGQFFAGQDVRTRAVGGELMRDRKSVV